MLKPFRRMGTEAKLVTGRLPLPPMTMCGASHNQRGTRHTLVLDIDDTLLTPDLRPRRFLPEFLSEVVTLFEVVVWTASTVTYAVEVMDRLDPSGLLDRRLFLGMSATLCEVDRAKAPHEGIQIEASRCPSCRSVEANREVDCALRPRRSKWLPLLGRDMDRVLLFDDTRWHASLTPRNFLCSQMTSASRPYPPPEFDSVLRDVMPMLRATARAPSAIREADHWRPTGYERFDDVTHCCRQWRRQREWPSSTTAQAVANTGRKTCALDNEEEVRLGDFLPIRRAEAIQPFEWSPDTWDAVARRHDAVCRAVASPQSAAAPAVGARPAWPNQAGGEPTDGGVIDRDRWPQWMAQGAAAALPSSAPPRPAPGVPRECVGHTAAPRRDSRACPRLSPSGNALNVG